MVPCTGPSQSQLKHIPLATKVYLRKPSAFLHNFLYEPFFFFFFFNLAGGINSGPCRALASKMRLTRSFAGLRQCQNSQGTHPRSTIPEGALETEFPMFEHSTQDTYWAGGIGSQGPQCGFPPWFLLSSGSQSGPSHSVQSLLSGRLPEAVYSKQFCQRHWFVTCQG